MMWLYAWLQHAIAAQREIYLALAARIADFAQTGDWQPLLVYLPMGIVFGAIHAATPGHSKALLATYLTGSSASLRQAMLTTWVLSLVHISTAVLIALLALPLVSVTLGSVGRAPALEQASRGLLGLIGLWMLWQALRGTHGHGHREGTAMGFMAGLIPCPLTLFVMTFTITRGVPQAGIAFAATMLIGVGLTLSAVAFAAVFFRQHVLGALARWPRLIDWFGRSIQAAAGLVSLVVAANAVRA